VGGIYTADPDKLSLRATMPRFLEMEAACGSIIRAMRKERKRAAGRDRLSEPGAQATGVYSEGRGAPTAGRVTVCSSPWPAG